MQVERALVHAADGGAAIVHRPAEAEGWLELLASGLSFDLTGLAPAGPAQTAAGRHWFGLGSDLDLAALEAVALAPGPHIAAGGALLPIVRVMAGLAAALARTLGPQAVVWHPAASVMEPVYFGRIVEGWLAGGAFPALGLTAVTKTPGGAAATEGLAFFCGQEIELAPKRGEAFSETAKLAARIADAIVRQGSIEQSGPLAGPGGRLLVADVSADGRRVAIRHSG